MKAKPKPKLKPQTRTQTKAVSLAKTATQATVSYSVHLSNFNNLAHESVQTEAVSDKPDDNETNTFLVTVVNPWTTFIHVVIPFGRGIRSLLRSLLTDLEVKEQVALG